MVFNVTLAHQEAIDETALPQLTDVPLVAKFLNTLAEPRPERLKVLREEENIRDEMKTVIKISI